MDNPLIKRELELHKRVEYIKSQLDSRPNWDFYDYRDFYDKDVNDLLEIYDNLMNQICVMVKENEDRD